MHGTYTLKRGCKGGEGMVIHDDDNEWHILYI